MITDIKIEQADKYLATFDGSDEYCMWTWTLLVHVCCSEKTNTTSPLYIMANIIKQQESRSHHTKLVNKHNNYKMCTCISQIKVSPQCATPHKKAGEILNV